jgi:nucleoid-associated protein YgaU
MSFARAVFTRLPPDLNPKNGMRMEVQYNPAEFTLTKGVQYAEIAIPGLDAPVQQFVRGENETLTVDLFFDTTEFGMGEETSVVPVTRLTDRFYQLIRVDPASKAPPVCLFSWGEQGFPGSNFKRGQTQLRQHGFQCLVENVTQKFTLFSPLGIPLRATLTVRMREYQTLTELVDALTETVVLVEEGATLDQVAARQYNDPGKWRMIAEQNGIDDPLAPMTGAPLQLPKV